MDKWTLRNHSLWKWCCLSPVNVPNKGCVCWWASTLWGNNVLQRACAERGFRGGAAVTLTFRLGSPGGRWESTGVRQINWAWPEKQEISRAAELVEEGMIKTGERQRVSWQESFPREARGEEKCGRQRRRGSQPSRQSPFDWKSLFARCGAAAWWNQKQSRAVWAAEVPTSAHAVLRKARFFRFAERTVWRAGNASHISVVLACFQWQRFCYSDPTHNTANLPGVSSSVTPEGAETPPQPASEPHENIDPVCSLKSRLFSVL